MIARIGERHPVVSQVIELIFGYAAAQLVELADPYASGAAIDDAVGPFLAPFQPVVPQLVVGTVPANVVNGTETGAANSVTGTLTGTDITGAALSRTVSITAKGVYPFDRAFASITRFVTSGDVGAVAQLFVGKGFATASPFDETTLVVSMDGGSFANTPTAVHGPTGTVVPGASYNAAEGAARVRYRPTS